MIHLINLGNELIMFDDFNVDANNVHNIRRLNFLSKDFNLNHLIDSPTHITETTQSLIIYTQTDLV